jgi:hypothetical protein
VPLKACPPPTFRSFLRPWWLHAHLCFKNCTNRPWAVVRKRAWKSNFVATPWRIDFLWFNAQYHRCSITTKSSQAKNLPNTEKMGEQWLSSIKLYYSKKMWNFVFNYNKILKAYKNCI